MALPERAAIRILLFAASELALSAIHPFSDMLLCIDTHWPVALRKPRGVSFLSSPFAGGEYNVIIVDVFFIIQ
ncbi:MAG: hypothetical protein U5L09_00410 [Bacteroidales bacterium]|nr:hypothetical protein [Bacteroidales bacterium]